MNGWNQIQEEETFTIQTPAARRKVWMTKTFHTWKIADSNQKTFLGIFMRRLTREILRGSFRGIAQEPEKKQKLQSTQCLISSILLFLASFYYYSKGKITAD